MTRLAAAASFDLDKTSHRRLDPLLLDTDIRLQTWAVYAMPFYAARGFPVGGDARCEIPRVEWPTLVLATDAAVGVLYWGLGAAVMANYFNLDRPTDERAVVYAHLVQHFASLKPPMAGTQAPPGAFCRNVDRARWSLRALLRPP